jgi:uncharacterized protein YyaL (SSP411 family)
MLLQISTNTALFRQSLMALALFTASTLMLAAVASDVAFAQDFSEETRADSEKESKKKEKKEREEDKSDAKTNTAETAKLIEALAEHIKVLEEKLGRIGGEAPTVTAKTGDEVKPDDIAEHFPGRRKLLLHYQGTVVKGNLGI